VARPAGPAAERTTASTVRRVTKTASSSPAPAGPAPDLEPVGTEGGGEAA
jgi:hypothetical protein